MLVKIYGCRGSISSSRSPASIFGVNTSCMSVVMSGRTIILDAGTGLVQFGNEIIKSAHDVKFPLDILLSHLHLDHIIGLTVFNPVWGSDTGIRVYTGSRDDRPLKQQVFGGFVPPYWPTSMIEKANAECILLDDDISFNLGPIKVTPFIASHPDYTHSFHLTDGRQTLVHLLDSEIKILDKTRYDKLVKYCTDADIVVFDAAYSPVDYHNKKGWGHSTIEDGFKLAELSNCKQMVFSHYGFEYSDEDLKSLEALAKSRGEKFIFARDGMELHLT